ncbi:tripartite tricarboxylate transporter TctB family protein [Denitromonas iodatirespirans]|uniref:Tripartite tricarboxylate transporter TctB family protein n=1 Tax=Denitromonas iodatirespirans TaxID=2795389 RepID=A0A944D7X4_DENI1|nr:tripartite tricarboxylate transporter TctB family protein [Denitromonas iodatirespirans]MBT0959552.1 tripartite tricarboxylate transporter TctB family protein [Denitromonas iodatirespirans]
MEKISDFFKVRIDFDQSHLFFPTIVEWVLVVLMLAIVVTHGRHWVARWRETPLGARIRAWEIDKRRLFGCLTLTPVYFAVMEPVGTIYPNTGVGFLLTSYVYGFALSWLFVHDNNRRKTLLMALNALVTPTVVWFVFAHIFRITLP